MDVPPATPTDQPSIVEALIVGGDADWLFLVLTPYYLEVARASILDIEELPSPDTVRGERAVAARIILQAGTVIRALRSSQDLEAAVRRRRSSFPTASRPIAPSPTREDPALTALTAVFFARHGIADDGAP